ATLGVLSRQSQKEFAQCLALTRFVGFELNTSIEVPTENQNLMCGRGHCLAHKMVIVGCVDNNGGLLCAFNTPTVFTGNDDRQFGWHYPGDNQSSRLVRIKRVYKLLATKCISGCASMPWCSPE